MGTYDSARAKTKSVIIDAFWKIYTKKDISKITVREITETAGIHRATFYLYFDSVFAVLNEIKSERLQKLRDICDTYSFPGIEAFLFCLQTKAVPLDSAYRLA